MFGKLDNYLWRLTYKWAIVQPREQAELLGRSPVLRQVQQVQTGPMGVRRPPSGAYMHKFSWTNIVRHPIVMGTASPDDPALAEYWAWRRRKVPLPINHTAQELHRAQDGAARSAGVAARRGPATNPARVGDAGWRPPARRSTSCGNGTPTRLNPVSYTLHCRTRQRPGTSARPSAIRACLSRMPGNWQVRFLGGPAQQCAGRTRVRPA